MADPSGKLEVPCPNCGKPVAWSTRSKWRPFCSERCRLIDLGAWFDEERSIPAEDTPPDEEPEAH
ncbi:MAG: DNA gyrase inhibitor YacG [Gammaproteobacteria bacterium]